jgi:hypothetical protein
MKLCLYNKEKENNNTKEEKKKGLTHEKVFFLCI